MRWSNLSMVLLAAVVLSVGCSKPMQLFLQLNLGKLPDELKGRHGEGLLQLFYCTNSGDGCEEDGGWEPFATGCKLVRIVHPSERHGDVKPPDDEDRFPAKTIVGWNAFDDHPDSTEHKELGLTYDYDFDADTVRVVCVELGLASQPIPEMDYLAEEISNAAMGDKLGGWPGWIQGVEYPSCPKCRRRMRHIFQIDSEDNLPYMFGDVGCGHVTQCPEHKEVVAFGWACS